MFTLSLDELGAQLVEQKCSVTMVRLTTDSWREFPYTLLIALQASSKLGVGKRAGIQGLTPKLENHRITSGKREMHKMPATRKVLLSRLVRLQ